MSSPEHLRLDVVPYLAPDIPDNTPQEVEICGSRKGMTPRLAGVIRDPGMILKVDNLSYTSDGRLSSCVGDGQSFVASDTIISLFVYKLGNDRMTIGIGLVGVYYRLSTSSTAIAMTGPAFTGLYVGETVTFASWADQIIFTNPVIGMYVIDPVAKTYANITDAPQDAQFVANFNGRLVVSGLRDNPRRIQWSVKFSSTDWSGLGSGFEDLQSTYSRAANYPLVLVPVDDNKALLFREDSVDQVSTTGFSDAPFVFSELHKEIANIAPFTIAATSHGVVTLTHKGALLVALDSVQPFGLGLLTTNTDQPYIPGSASELTTYRIFADSHWFGLYHAGLDEYWVTSGELPGHESVYGTGGTIYRYQFAYGGWTATTVPSISSVHQTIVAMAVSAYNSTITYGVLKASVATYDLLNGHMSGDAYKTSFRSPYAEVVVAVGSSADVVNVYNIRPYNAQGTWGNDVVSQSAPGYTLISGDIDLVARNRALTVHELEIEYVYLGTMGLIMTVEYSIDCGVNYSTLGTIDLTGVAAGGQFRLRRIEKVITGKQVRFRFTGTPTHAVNISYIKLRGIVNEVSKPYDS